MINRLTGSVPPLQPTLFFLLYCGTDSISASFKHSQHTVITGISNITPHIIHIFYPVGTMVAINYNK